MRHSLSDRKNKNNKNEATMKIRWSPPFVSVVVVVVADTTNERVATMTFTKGANARETEQTMAATTTVNSKLCVER